MADFIKLFPSSPTRFYRRLALFLLLAPATGGLSPAQTVIAPVEVRVGITSTRAGSTVASRWAALGRYLGEQIPEYRFRIVPLDLVGIETAVARNEIDFAICSSNAYIDLKAKYGLIPLATYRYAPRPGAVTNRMGGTVFFRSKMPNLHRIEDLRGKRVAAVDPQAMGGWISVWRELKAAGLDPSRDLAGLRFLESNEAVIEAVDRGQADVGVVPTGNLERLSARGVLFLGDYRTLPPPSSSVTEPPFPLLHSTRLYPERPFLKLSHVPDSLARSVTVALLTMPDDGETARATETAGWTIPPDYRPVEECLRELELGPFRDYGKLTLRSVLNQYWDKILIVLISLVCFLTGTMVWMAALNRRLHKLSRALSERESRYRALFDGGTDAIFVHGLDPNGGPGTFIEVNDIACRCLGYSREELLGMSPLELNAPESAPAVPGVLQRIVMDSQAVWEGTLQSKDGRRIPVEISNRMFDFEGRKMVFASVRDITERKKAEEDRSRLEEQLRQSQKMESIGRLAGGVAHDFNNLLTIINGYSDLLLDHPGLHESIRSPLEEIKKAGDQAAGLTQQLLAFSRRQVGKLEPLCLPKVLIEMEQMLHRVMGEDIEILTSLDAETGDILADRNQIQQVIMNLAVNARDAMPHGGKLILQARNLAASEEWIHLHPKMPDGSYVLLCVEDTGVGMDKETCQHAFEPFFTTKEKGKGTGLGLSMVYGIVRQHRGWVWVRSEPGEGTSFQICLPRMSAEEGIAAEAAAPPRMEGGNETILLVEDQGELRNLASKVLKFNGYRVLEASSGEEALEVQARHSGAIQLLLTDVIMPGITGKELAGKLHPVRPEMKVLFMSGYTEDVIAHHGVLEEGVAFLAKPFTPKMLAAKVREVLGARSTKVFGPGS